MELVGIKCQAKGHFSKEPQTQYTILLLHWIPEFYQMFYRKKKSVPMLSFPITQLRKNVWHSSILLNYLELTALYHCLWAPGLWKPTPVPTPTPQLNPAFLSNSPTFGCQSMSTHSAVQLCCYCFLRLCERGPQCILHVVSTDHLLHCTKLSSKQLLWPPRICYYSPRHSVRGSVGQTLRFTLLPQTKLIWLQARRQHTLPPPIHPSAQTRVTPPAQ